MDVYDAALQEFPNNKLIRSLRNRLKTEGNNIDEADFTQAKLVERYQDELMPYIQLLLDNYAFFEAEQKLKELLELKPHHNEAALLYLHVLNWQKKYKKVMSTLKTWVTEYPQHIEWHKIYANILIEKENYSEALKQYEVLSQLDPKTQEYIYMAGETAIRSGQTAIARQYLTILLNSDSQEYQSNAHYLLGQLAEYEKQPDKAIEWYKKVSDISGFYLNAQTRVVLLLVEQGRSREALQYLHTIQANKPKDYLAFRKLEADILINEKQYEKTLSIYNQILEAEPNNTDILYLRALLLGNNLGNIELFEQDMRQILMLEPENAQFLNAFAYTLMNKTQRYKEAYTLIKKAFSLKPDEFYILDTLGWALYRLKRYDEAIKFIRQALDKQPDPEAAAHLGEVLWMNGQHKAARQVWEKASEQFPSDERLLKVIQRFLP